MKKIMISMSLLAGMLLAAQAQAMDMKEMHGSASLALADADGFSDAGFTMILKGRMPMPNVHPQFSVEGEFDLSLVKPETGAFGGSVELSYFSFGGFGVFSHPVSPEMSVFGRAGLMYVDSEISGSGFGGSLSDSTIELAIGGGARFAMNEQMGILAELTLIDELTHISAGIEYKFK